MSPFGYKRKSGPCRRYVCFAPRNRHSRVDPLHLNGIAVDHRGDAGHVGQGRGGEQDQDDGEGAHGYSLPWLGENESPAVSAFRHPGNRLALVPAQGLDRQPGLLQIGLLHGDRRLGQRPGDAVVAA